MWIQSYQELGSHPKTLKLARILNVSLPAVIGHLHFFWWWALDYAQDGDISRFDELDVAIGAKWDGDPQKFENAMIRCQFIDVENDQKLIHDWADYGGKLIIRKKAEADRMKKKRALTANDQSELDEHTENDQSELDEHTANDKKELDEHTAHVHSTYDERSEYVGKCSSGEEKRGEEKRGEEINSSSTRVRNSDNQAPCDRDPPQPKVVSLYEEYFGHLANPFLTEKISLFVTEDHMKIDLIELAFRRAREEGKDLGYANGILRKWAQKGITTLETAEKEVIEFRRKKGALQELDEFSEDFLEFWSIYPRKDEQRGAWEEWNARLEKHQVSPQDLIKAAVNYANECKQFQREMKYIKLGANFLGDKHPYEDYVLARSDPTASMAGRFKPREGNWRYEENRGGPEEDIQTLLRMMETEEKVWEEVGASENQGHRTGDRGRQTVPT